jgi:hypothetical protein
MLDNKMLLDAIGGVRPEYVLDAQQVLGYGSTKQRKSRKNLWRTILLAAVIAALLGATAYAGYNINQQRQQELRERLEIEENNISSYSEYSVPSVNDESQYTVVPLSASSDGEIITVYFNVSPVDELIAQLSDGINIVYHVDGEDGWCIAHLMTNDNVRYDPETNSINIEDCMYDPETRTATMSATIYADRHEPGKSIEITVAEWPSDEVLGSFTFIAPEDELRTYMFDTPLEFRCEELDVTARVLGLEVSPFSATWLIERPNMDHLYYGTESDWECINDEQLEHNRHVQGAWVNTEDLYSRGTLHMADGTDVEIPGCILGANYENGIDHCHSASWNGSIDINAVVAVTVNGTRVELH